MDQSVSGVLGILVSHVFGGDNIYTGTHARAHPNASARHTGVRTRSNAHGIFAYVHGRTGVHGRRVHGHGCARHGCIQAGVHGYSVCARRTLSVREGEQYTPTHTTQHHKPPPPPTNGKPLEALFKPSKSITAKSSTIIPPSPRKCIKTA